MLLIEWQSAWCYKNNILNFDYELQLALSKQKFTFCTFLIMQVLSKYFNNSMHDIDDSTFKSVFYKRSIDLTDQRSKKKY